MTRREYVTDALCIRSAGMFVANGLLASSSSQVHHSKDPVQPPANLKFVPNGLLGTSKIPETTASLDTEIQVPLTSALTRTFAIRSLITSVL